MKKLLLTLGSILILLSSHATIHVVFVQNSSFSFVSAQNGTSDITIQLGDTVQWMPGDQQTMAHTITSTSIPSGASTFDYAWSSPNNLFFEYVPAVIGMYQYQCTPHVGFGMVGSINVQTTAVTESPLLSEAVFFPNPAKNDLYFSGMSPNLNFSIFDYSGKLMLKGTVEEVIDITALPDGIYIIELQSDEPKYFKFSKL